MSVLFLLSVRQVPGRFSIFCVFRAALGRKVSKTDKVLVISCSEETGKLKTQLNERFFDRKLGIVIYLIMIVLCVCEILLGTIMNIIVVFC